MLMVKGSAIPKRVGSTMWYQACTWLLVACGFTDMSLFPHWYIHYDWLVVSTPLKNMKVTWDDYSQYMGK